MKKTIVCAMALICFLSSSAFSFEGDFIALCGTGSLDQVKEALQGGADLSSSDLRGQTPLLKAVQKNPDPAVIRLLVESGADINARDKSGESALTVALGRYRNSRFVHPNNTGAGLSKDPPEAYSKELFEIISLLVKKGADVNAEPHGWRCPLRQAIETGDPALVSLLLEAGAEVDPELKEEKKSLLALLFTERFTPVPSPEILKILIEANGGPNDRKGVPLLFHALSRGNERWYEDDLAKSISILLDAGTDVNARNAEGITPLMLAARIDSSVVRLLLERGADIHAQVKGTQHTALHSALWGNGDFETIRLLVEAGSDVNARNAGHKDGFFYTPLSMAMIWSMDSRIFKLLLEKGADVRNATCEEDPPLLVSAIQKQAKIQRWESFMRDKKMISEDKPIDLLNLLIQAGADVNETRGKGNPKRDPRTPLMVAVQVKEASLDVVKLLLDNGADVNARISGISIRATTGNTALILAALTRSNPAFIETLVDYGADVNALNEDGESALMVAVKYNPRLSIIKALIGRGADVNTRTQHNRTALMEAALRHENAEILEILIDAGAHVEVQAFELAEAYNPKKEILEALRNGYRQQRQR